ncbi:3-oxoadipate enol-lactonase [Rhizobacter sp. AJA081-3]|uniref:bifunctional 4-carboxymuconolactone decarboxylase/3-oxoadipate enol-lactonase PcaCD n=1 Tax=Rhizobacter sp. AJA081-3 TaxID=2753607 RepID=UPI001ADF854D|nr:3-oxoadipate enol-lactonase [Rhizobacter sp. AJA081-3]QTN21825.1 3-oxoadipate enol-lactonase [Rhizobacter sp. AJA081-3]
MDRSDDFERGVLNRRAVLGDEWVDQSLGGTTQFNADFQDLVTRHAWLDIWGRPGLDVVTRRLLVLGMTMAAARWEEFELHCKATVRAGVPLEKIRETLMQGAIYCGVPAANTAFKITSKILRDEGLLPPPAPLTAGVRAAIHHTFSTPQLKVALQGQGTPVVLSHALGADLHLWDELAAALGEQHEVLRYDHRGHGGSAVPAGPYAQDDLVDDAARLILEWGRGPVVFIGLSMGGMVGQGLAVRHPELLSGLVIANSSARYPAEARAMWDQRIAAIEQGGLATIAEGTMERWFTPGFRAAQPEVVERTRQVLLRTPAAGYIACGRAVQSVDWLDRLAAVRAPTLVIAGAQDAGAPPAMSEAMAARIAGAQLTVLDSAHISVLEQPQAFLDAVRGFIGARCP